MISEFVITPQVFEEIISSFDEDVSLLLVALTIALKKSCKNNIFVVNLNSGKWQETAIRLSMKMIERQTQQLENAPNDDISKKKFIYLKTIHERLNDFWRQLDQPGCLEFMIPFRKRAINEQNEQDWLDGIFDSFNPENHTKPYPRPFCLITSQEKNGPYDRNNFKNTIKWKNLLEILFDLNATVYDSRKSFDHYFEAIQKLLHLSSTIAIVTPFATNWVNWDNVTLTPEFEMILNLIEKKIRNHNYPYRLQKLIVIVQEDSKKTQRYPDADRPKIVAEQKKYIEDELKKRFKIASEVQVSCEIGSQKIVDRRLYFGTYTTETCFQWGVSISHYFDAHDYGGVVALLSNDDIASFMKMAAK